MKTLHEFRIVYMHLKALDTIVVDMQGKVLLQ